MITLIHCIGAKTERKVEKALLNDLKRVNGKTGLLFRLAEASLEEPDGRVKEVIYPVVNKITLKAIVKEWKSTGPLYRTQVQTRIRSSYRRILAPSGVQHECVYSEVGTTADRHGFAERLDG